MTQTVKLKNWKKGDTVVGIAPLDGCMKIGDTASFLEQSEKTGAVFVATARYNRLTYAANKFAKLINDPIKAGSVVMVFDNAKIEKVFTKTFIGRVDSIKGDTAIIGGFPVSIKRLGHLQECDVEPSLIKTLDAKSDAGGAPIAAVNIPFETFTVSMYAAAQATVGGQRQLGGAGWSE